MRIQARRRRLRAAGSGRPGPVGVKRAGKRVEHRNSVLQQDLIVGVHRLLPFNQARARRRFGRRKARLLDVEL
jgi:hypothetical protein